MRFASDSDLTGSGLRLVVGFDWSLLQRGIAGAIAEIRTMV